MSRLKAGAIILAVTAATFTVTSAAWADSVSNVSVAQGNKYRGGVPALGGVAYKVTVTVAKDPAGEIVNVRGGASITKRTNVTAVQVDKVTLGTSTRAVLSNATPNNSGPNPSASSSTNWHPVTRANFSIRWSDNALSHFSILTGLVRVCGPTAPPKYANCARLNQTFPHGVGRVGAHDSTSGTPVTDFYVSNWIYSGNTARDADKDHIACEQH
jgi:Excalibur calcium-binding domain